MDQLLTSWEAMPEGVRKLTLAMALLVLVLGIQRQVQKGLRKWGIDLLLSLPKSEGGRAPDGTWLSTTLSWLMAATLPLLAALLSREKLAAYTVPLLIGWSALTFYLAALFLIRTAIQALVDLLNHPQVAGFLQSHFEWGERKPSPGKGQDLVSALADFIGAATYPLFALLLGSLLLIDLLGLHLFGQLLFQLLSGVGRLLIALVLIGFAIWSLNRLPGSGQNAFQTRAESGWEAPNRFSWTQEIVLGGAVLLAVTLLADRWGALLVLLLALLLLFTAPLLGSSWRERMADILAGFYLRVRGCLGASLRGERRGSRLVEIGWTISTLENDRGETELVPNRKILESGIEIVPAIEGGD